MKDSSDVDAESGVVHMKVWIYTSGTLQSGQ